MGSDWIMDPILYFVERYSGIMDPILGSTLMSGSDIHIVYKFIYTYIAV